MKKVVLRNSFSPGDIVFLTAAVRDLHVRFLTDVRTPCPQLWENNPYLTPLDERDPAVEVIDCHYPLINRSNRAPYHVIHGFIEFLNQRKLFLMKGEIKRLEAEYARLKKHLSQVGWMSEGYVQDRGPGAGGPCYQWTRKVRGKTVSVALSREQFEWFKEAIANWRQVQETLKQMQKLSRQVLFATVTHPRRRKRLSKRVLGII